MAAGRWHMSDDRHLLNFKCGLWPNGGLCSQALEDSWVFLTGSYFVLKQPPISLTSAFSCPHMA